MFASVPELRRVVKGALVGTWAPPFRRPAVDLRL
jgi:hypothetical protein